ncbi:glycosyltransferase [Streptomyces uncialis]|uniref:glycosyltransferase n=1 Tax=Streptomyces uncialis TaxID=1048205 RepID=UPI0038695BB5|nr:glycosyltransferase [Streptomyces uncialis]
MPSNPSPTGRPDTRAEAARAARPPRPGRAPDDAPPRVLHVVQPVTGGVPRVVLDLIQQHLTAPDAPRLLVACPEQGPLAGWVTAAGADWLRWDATRSPGTALPSEIRALARLIARTRPGLVHAHSAKAGLAARLALRGRVPTVFQPHAWSFEAVEGTAARLARRWEVGAARWASRIVCVSEAERATGEAAGVRGHWTVVPNGVDTDRFRPEPPAHDVLPRARRAPHDAPPALAGTDPRAPLVVCVARLCRQKGQDVLLRAWPEVVRRVPGARLALVGDGPDGERLRAGSPEGVIFAGAAEDPAPWYRAADLVVLPSRWEGMALAPLEAMACGRPVLLTDVAGARESLAPGHRAYCLVPPGDPAALARAAAGLLLDAPRRAALGAQGRRHVLTTHDVRQSARAVAAVYRDILGAERPKCRESTTS